MLRDEIKPNADIVLETHAMRVTKQQTRDEIARLMAEFESRCKVETAPIGASKDYNFQESQTNSEKRAKGTKSAMNAPQGSGQGLADFRGQLTQKQRKQRWKESDL